MEYRKLIILLSFLIVEVHLLLPDDKRKELLKKYTQEINEIKENFRDSHSEKVGITYDKAIIKQLLKDYNFPENFNYLKENNVSIHIKNQKSCGSCWSHASTSALGYRFKKLGVDVNLSPQPGLSCYVRSCSSGNTPVDAQMHLVKNGTMTEECFPFSSEDGKNIEECPSKCKNGSDIIRYYAQNMFSNRISYSDKNFYDYVAIIMDQLIAKGPVVASIKVYSDFEDMAKNPKICKEIIYSHNGTEELLGGHSVVIVGYGFQDNKYYWLVQNSWGDDFCDNGFIKIEFGQIFIERVSFSEPYIHDPLKTKKEIQLRVDSINPDCSMNLKYDTNLIKDWNNTLHLAFKNTAFNDLNLYFHDNFYVLPNKTKIFIMNLEYLKLYSYKGKYELLELESLGDENTFTLIGPTPSFQTYGNDNIEYFINNTYFVSGEGSKINFLYKTDIEGLGIPPIYPNYANDIILKNCSTFPNFPLLSCDLQKDEFDIIQDYGVSQPKETIYKYLCGYLTSTGLYLYKLDKTKYPVYRIKDLIISTTKVPISKNNSLYISADIEGAVPFTPKKNYFYVPAIIKCNSTATNVSDILLCEINTDYVISCKINKTIIEYEEISILPFYALGEMSYPFEIIIKGEIKGKMGDKPIPTIPPIKPSSSELTKISYLLLLIFLLF